MAKETRSEHYAGGFPENLSAFSSLIDPRTGRNKRHYFGEVLFISLAAIICQCEGFDDMERFATGRKEWLQKHLKLPHGVPSNDTFRRIFTAIDPEKFNACFMSFVSEQIDGDLGTQLIAIDGKAARHSFDSATNQKHLHLLSAYACEHGLSLAQLAVDVKTNEINAVPHLLDLLDLEGHTVSLDAMGCQKKIARQINFAQGHYLLALKGNHPQLHQRLEQFFGKPGTFEYTQNQGHIITSHEVEDKGHGRYEKRLLVATNALDWIDKNERESWMGLKSFLCVESTRTDLNTNETSTEKRYYISSHEPEAQVLHRLVRQHWGIENSCHWILDVVWNEDASRIRKGNAAENVALLRKIALNLLKLDKTVKDTIRGKRLQATFSETMLEQLLRLKVS